MNISYKHLESKLRIGELTFGQWGAVVAGLFIAILWGTQLSPFGTYLTFASAVYIGAIPAGAALFASASELDLLLLGRSALAWRRRDGRYLPGPGESTHGYVLREDPSERLEPEQRRPYELDLAALWDS